MFCVVVGATIGFSLLAGDWTSIREELVSDVVIEHNHGVVWDVLTGVDDFDDWSSTIDEVKGNLTTGQHVRVTFRVFPFVSVPMEVLSRFEYSSLRIAFLGGHRGLFSAEFIVDLTDEPDGCTRARITSLFRGSWVSPFFPFVGGLIEETQKQFLADLAAKAVSLKQTTK